MARCPTPTRLVLVHCVDSCPFPAPGEWPADVRPVIAAHWPPVRYVSQHVGEAAAAVLQRLEAATVGCQAQRQEQKVRLQKQRWWCRTGRRKLQKERKQQQEEHMSGAGSVAGVVGSSGVGCGVSLADLQCGPGSEGGSVSAELDRLRRRARELLLQQACVPLGGCPAGSGAGALAAAAAAAWSRGQGAGADTPWPGAAGAAAAAGGVELHGAAWGPVWGTPVRCEPHALPTPRNELPATGVQPCKPAPPPVAIPSATHGSSPGEQLHAPVEGVAMVHKKASNRFPRLQLPGAICGSAAGDGGSPALWPLVSGRTDESRQDSQQVSPKLRPCKYLLRYMHPAWAVPVSYVCAQLEAGMELGQGEVLLEAAWDGEAGTVGGSCLDGMGACGAEGSVKRVSEAGVVRFGNGPAGDAADAHMQQQQQRQQQTVENQEDREGLPALRLNRLHGGDAEACGSTSAASFRSASSTNESRSHSRRSSSCGASGLGLHTVRAGPGACGAVALGRAASGEVRMQGQVQGPGGALGQLVAAANPLPCRKLQAPLGCAVSGSTSHSRGQGLWATHPQPQQRHQHQQGRPGCEDSERAAAAAVLSSPVSAGGRRGQGGESGPLSPLSPLSPVSSCSVRTGWAAEEDGGQQRPGSGCHATKTATGQAAVRTGGSVGGPRGGAGVWDEGGVAGGGSRMASGDGGACVAMGSRGVGGESSGGSSVVVLFLAPGYVVGSACLRGILGVLRRQQAHKSGGRAGPSVQPAGAAGGGGGAGGKGASLGLGSTGCGDVRLQLVVDADCRQRLPDTRPLDVTTDEWKVRHRRGLLCTSTRRARCSRYVAEVYQRVLGQGGQAQACQQAVLMLLVCGWAAAYQLT